MDTTDKLFDNQEEQSDDLAELRARIAALEARPQQGNGATTQRSAVPSSRALIDWDQRAPEEWPTIQR